MNNTIRITLLGLALLTLQGCASSPKELTTPDVEVPLSEKSVAEQIGQARSGDELVFKNFQQLESETVVVGREYTAASGRPCRRLLDESGMPLDRVACLGDDKSWYLARQLNSRPVKRVDADDSTEPLQLQDSMKKTGSDSSDWFAIKEGETLWSFSQRTTGNARNWEKIAIYNRIVNANNVPAGTMLAIPPDMI